MIPISSTHAMIHAIITTVSTGNTSVRSGSFNPKYFEQILKQLLRHLYDTPLCLKVCGMRRGEKTNFY